MPGLLSVSLGTERVGTIANLAGDANLFSFEQRYLDDTNRPVLSQAYIGVSGEPVTRISRTHRVAPAFFANLLPEEGSVLRSLIANQHRISRTRDFPYLRVLGRDLPGAVVIRDAGELHDGEIEPVAELSPGERPLRFSLAGVQLKFSASTTARRRTGSPA